MALFGETNDNRGEIGTRLASPISPGFTALLRELGLRILVRFEREVELHRSRRALLDLNDDQLRDIGISRTAADREGRRSFFVD